jgi:ubiquinone/menaquinone biosynthesis C-methylase UbiE
MIETAPYPEIQLEPVLACPLCESELIVMADAANNICVCTCGFVFDSPRPTLESITAFYSAKGKYETWVARDGAYDRLWKRRLKSFLRYTQPGNLLDIGAGIGQFLSIAKPYFSSVSGTEVSLSGAAVAEQKYGIALTIGDIHSLSLPADSFNNITLFHVLEHVEDPIGLLVRCRNLLCEGGTLVVCVPNDVLGWKSLVKAVGKRMGVPRFKKFSARFGFARAGATPEIHLSHFTPATLTIALEKAGFRVSKMDLDPYFAASWMWTIPHATYFRFHSLLHRLTGQNRYDAIMAIARKA